MSVQADPGTSQKLTWPVVSAVLPTTTLAVSVTTLPDATVVAGVPPEVMASVVAVEGGCPQSNVVPETLAE
jgi:hypothetical protein